MILIYLTCKDNEEANKISESFLKKRLVACAKKLPVESKFWWEGKIDNTNEVMVMFETVEDKFEAIEKEVDRLHSYDTPMLFSVTVSKTTDKVEAWLKEEIS